MAIEDFGRAEALKALQPRRARHARRLDIGLCAVVIVALSLLGWAVIVWPLVAFLQ